LRLFDAHAFEDVVGVALRTGGWCPCGLAFAGIASVELLGVADPPAPSVLPVGVAAALAAVARAEAVDLALKPIIVPFRGDAMGRGAWGERLRLPIIRKFGFWASELGRDNREGFFSLSYL
jgi:hypothetical protein